MSKRLILILALVFVVGIACAAYAEVQNVKVSGDITMMGIARNNFNLTNGTAGDKRSDNESNILSQIRVRIDADLTDSVMTTIRLINERNWTTETNSAVTGQSDTHIDVDLAYVTLKEFLYSPLSITVGRQELRYGNGLIIANARNYNNNILNGVPEDLTMRKAFDAVKAVLNYDPLVVDLVAAKISKPDPLRNRDTELLGVNAKYSIDKTTTAEAYFFNKQNRDKSGINNKADQIYTVGGLVSAAPVANLTASLEGAYQFGEYNTSGKPMQDRNAYAVQAKANYAIPYEKTKKWAPAIGGQYTYLSGSKNGKVSSNHAWDPMYYGYDTGLNNIVYAIVPFTNLQAFNLTGSIKPIDDVTLMLNYGYYLRAQKDSVTTMSTGYVNSAGTAYGTYTMTDKKYLGQEIDLTATYNYTEDVQFALTAGWFKAGKAFAKDGVNNNHDASQLIGSMKVTF